MAKKSRSGDAALAPKPPAEVGLNAGGAVGLPPATPDLRRLLSEHVDQAGVGFGKRVRETKAGKAIRKLDPARRALVLYAAYTRLLASISPGGHVHPDFGPLNALCGDLLSDKLPLQSDALAAMIGAWLPYARRESFSFLPIAALADAAVRHVKANGLTPGLSAALSDVRGACRSHPKSPRAKRTAIAIGGLLGETAAAPTAIRIDPGEAWADAALSDLNALPAPRLNAWAALLRHCRTATPSHPPKKWLATAAGHVSKIGADGFKPCVARWLPLIDLPRTHVLPPPPHPNWQPDPNHLIGPEHETLLKGLAWTCAIVDDADVARALADGALASFKKIRWKGPRCPKVGNACLDALALMPTPEAAAQLSRLSTSVKQPTGKKTVTKAIGNLAARTNQTPEDLEELAVPTYEMTTPGVLERTVGTFTARLDFTSPSDPEITYTSAAGKKQKSAPAELKADPALKAFQKLAKDVEKMFDAQRLRIERLPMSERSWSIEQWRQRYLHQPLLAPLTSRLIWTFTTTKNQTTTAIPRDGRLVTQDGKPFEPAADSTVRLWHPVGATADLVLAWRTFLQDREITQPFKQAHREIYILTDAELRTRTYSNRFAAHVIRQQQFRALCQQRGWKVGLIGSWDSGGDTTPTLDLPRHKLRVEFWVDVAAEGELGATGVVPYLSTDQVRFYRAGAARPLHLSDVPAMDFSEVMRDVDLFVAVCSVGNDPAWRDGGQAGAFANYWQSYSFGDLSQSAKTRREVLTTLLPKLKIADRCTLTERFLRVRGELRTYKIHLGSSNILMEPNDQYLCIVPNRGSGAADRLFLPFEGDPTLAIILSKAFMLAEDKAIKDPTITRQIKPAR